MGWDYIAGITRDELVRRLTTVEVSPEWRCEAHELAQEHAGGQVLWAVWAERGGSRREIACHLLEPGRGGWGHKDMAEASGPYFYSCPLRFLELAPEVNPAWRAQVRAYHERGQGFDRGLAMLALSGNFGGPER